MLKNLVVLLLVFLCLPFPTSYAESFHLAPEKEKKSLAAELFININTASAEEIATILTGIGLKKAQAIVKYRNDHGAFKTVDDLVNVKGVGPSLLKKNHNRIQLQ